MIRLFQVPIHSDQSFTLVATKDQGMPFGVMVMLYFSSGKVIVYSNVTSVIYRPIGNKIGVESAFHHRVRTHKLVDFAEQVKIDRIIINGCPSRFQCFERLDCIAEKAETTEENGNQQSASQVTDINRVIDLVAGYYNVKREEVMNGTRSQPAPNARHAAMYLVYKHFRLNHAQVGRIFNRHRTTAIYAIRMIDESLDPNVRTEIKELENIIDNELYNDQETQTA